MIKIAAVGDLMPGGILSGVNKGWVSPTILSILNESDIRVGTLETAVGNEPSFYKEKMDRLADVIYVKDEDLLKIQQLKIDILSLANNHFFDLGPKGAFHTIELLDQKGIKHIGAGRNIEEASKPYVKIIDGKKVTFLAFCDWRNETVGWCPFATHNNPGVNPMYDNYVVDEIKKYKKQSDYVVVMPHWGQEHTWVTTNHVYSMSRIMVNAGADLILGSHPHRVQPIVNFNSASVAYSMGNFLFPDRLIIKPRSTYYPDMCIDLSTLPVTEAYPYVEELTYKKWKPLARIGMIVFSVIEDKRISSKYKLTHEQEDGFITLYEDKWIKSRLFFRGIILRFCPYNYFLLIERYFLAFLRKIKTIYKLFLNTTKLNNI